MSPLSGSVSISSYGLMNNIPLSFVAASVCLDLKLNLNLSTVYHNNPRPSLPKIRYGRLSRSENFLRRMDPPAPATASVSGIEDDEWELCNDDGFVYKRRKRRRVADSDADTAGERASRPPDPAADLAAEERHGRERKRRILMKLKRKYEKEIDQWETLSSSLSAMQEKANRFQMRLREHWQNTEEKASFPESSSGGAAPEQGDDTSGRPSLLDELVFTAEAHEAIIHDVSNLCEVAEEMCRVEEEQWKQPFFDLPVWGSPTDLMASLCDG